MENSGRNTAPKGQIRTHGLFIGEKHSALETAIALAQEKNNDFVETGIKKCVVYLTPEEFKSTYAVKNITRPEIEGVGFQWADYDEMAKRYDPETLQYGYNTMPDGEEIYFIPQPGAGSADQQGKFLS